ncbi:transcriptional regulator, XRE family [Natronoarchaeum philippinense]|uniref:Transcriptional regulator, XRE family n=1 Tax=Natronoarchaeum philippinense TaxID=558529 RepID=A0A285NA87_NATPI|nr:multiprotein-bridging factor 1 family protein [Natronoarchaeum philippinense]SNZ05827.1 transcriptional regulator, XRE family [Natronoarchaeum philippinense]
MAKYSTGSSSGSGDADACELCGATSASLRPANVAGAELDVCPDCAPHDDNAHKDQKKTDQSGGDSGTDRNPVEAANSETSMWDGDTSRWEEEGTHYDDDPLPYLVTDYGSVAESARQDAGLQREELAEELELPESDLLAIEQGRANQAGVSGSMIAALEERLGVELAE